MTEPLIPTYSQASLPDLTCSLLSAVGDREFPNPLGIPSCQAACLLLIDGLGWKSLLQNRSEAPFLSSLVDESTPITSSFPATTATSIASLGTGLPPGEHGIVGYTFRVPGHDRPMNALSWGLYGDPPLNLSEQIPSDQAQPRATAFERARKSGIKTTRVGPIPTGNSGLSRAVLRGSEFIPVFSMGDLVAQTLDLLGQETKTFVFSYHSDLDTTGHVWGVGSESWRKHLSFVDELTSMIARGLPKGSTLVITGDHGMVDVRAEERLDLDDYPSLAAGVRFMGGEGRCRYLYVEAGAGQDVLSAWRDFFGDRAWVLSKEEAVEAGWFGPTVEDYVSARIGDVIFAARDAVGIFQRTVDPRQGIHTGHHGSLTSDEVLVPLLQVSA